MKDQTSNFERYLSMCTFKLVDVTFQLNSLYLQLCSLILIVHLHQSQKYICGRNKGLSMIKHNSKNDIPCECVSGGIFVLRVAHHTCIKFLKSKRNSLLLKKQVTCSRYECPNSKRHMIFLVKIWLSKIISVTYIKIRRI